MSKPNRSMQMPKKFLEWYHSLEIVKANNGPAKGTISGSLIVLDRLQATYDLNVDTHLAERGTQIKGLSGANIKKVLARFGEHRKYSAEGGRTNRGALAEVKCLLVSLKELKLEEQDEDGRNASLSQMQSFLVERVADYFNRQKIKLTFNPALSTWHIVHNLLAEATAEGKSGYVAQHLVGAKLELRFPEITVSNEGGSTADMQTQRPGDFLIGHTAFHVTVAPMPPVFEKCLHNISQGYKPFILVPDEKLSFARGWAKQTSEEQITVESIESFVSQNINELSAFDKDKLTASVKDLVLIYNRRVDEAETDKSLMIELPSNLQ